MGEVSSTGRTPAVIGLLLMAVAACAVAVGGPGERRGAGLGAADWTNAPPTEILGQWKHVSPTSAVLYWQTNGAARSWVEFGRTAAYGQKTQVTQTARLGHLHRLTNLETGVEYHYRLACEGPDGRTLTSGDATLKPAAVEGAIRLPSGDNPPYVLDKPNATYLLTRNIEVEGTAFEITAAGIALDLDGHAVTYGTKARKVRWDRPKNAVHGVLVSKAPNVRLINGTIRQGAPNTNCHAVHIRGGDNPELAGLTVETVGDSAGVFSQWGFARGRIHHSKFLDSADRWVRTGGWWNPRACISLGAPGVKVDHNVLRGTYRLIVVRDAGGMTDRSGGEVFENDLYLDSWSRLSEAIRIELRGGVVRSNSIVCEGAASTGIMLRGSGARYSRVHSNRICIRPTRAYQPQRNERYGWEFNRGDVGIGITMAAGVYGLRVTGNEVIVRAGKYAGPLRHHDVWGHGRVALPDSYDGHGMRIVNMMFDDTNSVVRDNSIAAIRHGGGRAACIVVTGGSRASTLVFRNNRLASNWASVLISDRQHSTQAKGEQDGGRNARFVGNTFVRLGSSTDFRSVRCGCEMIDSSAVFLNTKLEGGAGWGDVSFEGSGGERELALGKAARLTVKDHRGLPVQGAEVAIRTERPQREYSAGITSAEGAAEIPIIDCVLTPEGRAPFTTNTIVVTKEGFDPSQLSVSPGQTEAQVTLKPGAPDPGAVIRELRERFPDRAKPEGEWDWLRAPLTGVSEEAVYASVTSACVYWQTDGRAWGYVEFGPTDQYGHKTQPFAKPNFAHLHHLKGLESSRTYHYRTVSIGVDGKRVASEDKRFTTRSPEGMTKVPDDVEGPPYRLDKAGRYLLTRDIACDHDVVFNIAASGVTLDLDGHTVLYGAGPPPGSQANAVHGRDLGKGKGVRILNGTIREGPHDAAGSHAVHLRGAAGVEIAWLRLEVSSFLTGALSLPYSGKEANVHHNLLWDRGHAYANRHQGCRTLAMTPGGVDARVHHNIIVGARNRAISVGHGGAARNIEVFENTVELIGHSTNSSALEAGGPGHKLHHNRIIARGEHPHGIWGCRDNRIYANKIDVAADMCISYEYGTLGGVGFRTNYDYNRYDGLEFSDNLLVVRAAEDAARGFRGARSWLFWLADIGKQNKAAFRNNTMVSMVYGSATTLGLAMSSSSPNLLFERNTLISNYRHVTFGTHRGDGRNSRWIANTFVKTGDHPDYATFGSARRKFDGNVLLDSRFRAGAGYDFRSKSYDKGDLAVQWYLDVKAAPGAEVAIADRDGKEVFAGHADREGKVRAALTECILRYAGRGKLTRHVATPHTVKVSKEGFEPAIETVNLNRNTEITVVLKRR